MNFDILFLLLLISYVVTENKTYDFYIDAKNGSDLNNGNSSDNAAKDAI